MSKRREKSFTLIELLVVITIIGILGVIAVVVFRVVIDRANFSRIVSDFKAITTAAIIYEKTNGSFPSDVGPGESPGFIPSNMTEWPKSPCAPDIIYDWDQWTSWGSPPSWTPITRVTLRRVADDAALFYSCVQPNPWGKCTCEDVSWTEWGGDHYCKGYGPIQNAPRDLTCSDLKDTTKFPRQGS